MVVEWSTAYREHDRFSLLNGQRVLDWVNIHIPIIVLVPTLLILWLAILISYERVFPGENHIPLYKIFSIQLVSWIFLGTSFALIVPNLGFETLLFNIGVYSFGWLIGYLAVFAPGGIGVRETAIVWMLSATINPEIAIIYSAIHRFLFIAVELLLGLVVSLINVSKEWLWIHHKIR